MTRPDPMNSMARDKGRALVTGAQRLHILLSKAPFGASNRTDIQRALSYAVELASSLDNTARDLQREMLEDAREHEVEINKVSELPQRPNQKELRSVLGSRIVDCPVALLLLQKQAGKFVKYRNVEIVPGSDRHIRALARAGTIVDITEAVTSTIVILAQAYGVNRWFIVNATKHMPKGVISKSSDPAFPGLLAMLSTIHELERINEPYAPAGPSDTTRRKMSLQKAHEVRVHAEAVSLAVCHTASDQGYPSEALGAFFGASQASMSRRLNREVGFSIFTPPRRCKALAFTENDTVAEYIELVTRHTSAALKHWREVIALIALGEPFPFRAAIRPMAGLLHHTYLLEAATARAAGVPGRWAHSSKLAGLTEGNQETNLLRGPSTGSADNGEPHMAL